MTNIAMFPAIVALEKSLRDKEAQGLEILARAEALKQEISKWENDFMEVGAQYVKAGGKELDLLDHIWEVTTTKTKFGTYIL